MKKKIKLFLSLSATLAAVVPIAAVLSCGSQNNSQKNKDQDIDINPSKLDPQAISTDSYLQEIKDTMLFYGQSINYSNMIRTVDNAALNKGLANVKINYGWSNAQGTEPSLVVDDYHTLTGLSEGDIFWVTLVPVAGFHIIDGNKSVLPITVKSSGIPNVEIYTDDFFNNVWKTVSFSSAPTPGYVIVNDNAVLNEGLHEYNQCVTFQYIWANNPALGPFHYFYDYHEIIMPSGALFQVKIVPKPIDYLAPGQNDIVTVYS